MFPKQTFRSRQAELGSEDVCAGTPGGFQWDRTMFALYTLR